MTRWLLAAEADKIQDLVFSSAHLREVVGGSQLLTRFCEELTPALLERLGGSRDDIIVADGGSFSILFDSKAEAKTFAMAFAGLYRELTGATLTAAEPIAWAEGISFHEANKRAREELAYAKRQGRDAAAVFALPYAAICQSCGQHYADRHEKLHKEERPNYLCPFCRLKADTRGTEAGPFLQRFKEAVVGKDHRFKLPSEADDLATGWDGRNYVAYLVADGNGMGRLFGTCKDEQQLKRLSEGLGDILRASLAEPTKLLMKQAPRQQEWRIQALPLILGGDDVFLLLPAPYALDFAARFCAKYEDLMRDFIYKELELSEIVPAPTMAAAVVVCKSKYPHTLAHHHAHRLLGDAKKLAKRVARTGPRHSVLAFDLIIGSHIAGVAPGGGKRYRGTLQPYWVTTDPTPPHCGIAAQELIRQRYALRGLPGRRLAQLRSHFAPEELPALDSLDALEAWQTRLQRLVNRAAPTPTPAAASGPNEPPPPLVAALAALGGGSVGAWYDVARPGTVDDGSVFQGHGLPDLLKMWDFALDLDHPRSEYLAAED